MTIYCCITQKKKEISKKKNSKNQNFIFNQPFKLIKDSLFGNWSKASTISNWFVSQAINKGDFPYCERKKNSNFWNI